MRLGILGGTFDQDFRYLADDCLIPFQADRRLQLDQSVVTVPNDLGVDELVDHLGGGGAGTR